MARRDECFHIGDAQTPEEVLSNHMRNQGASGKPKAQAEDARAAPEPKPVGYNVPPEAVRDPHHDGVCYWKMHEGRLYHLHAGASKWTQVKRVSFTPARIMAIASLLAPEPKEENDLLVDQFEEAVRFGGRIKQNAARARLIAALREREPVGQRFDIYRDGVLQAANMEAHQVTGDE